MSEPKRYAIRGFSAALVEEENGVFVRYEDYARLKAEVERLKGIILAQSSEFVRNATKQEEEPLPDGWNSSVAKACDLLAEKDKDYARLKAELTDLKSTADRFKAECQARQAENSVLAVECDSLKAEVERLNDLIISGGAVIPDAKEVKP